MKRFASCSITFVVVGLGLDSTRAFQASIRYRCGAIPPTAVLATTTRAAVNDSLYEKKNNGEARIDGADQPSPSISSTSSTSDVDDVGLYRRFAEHAWERLTALEYLQEVKIDTALQSNQSANNGRDGSCVHMTVKALQGAIIDDDNATCPIRYARYALLETLPANDNSIQVLNLVVFPNSNLPVWGADFVSLPGNKHLLLLDAQPMRGGDLHSQYWEEWYQSHSIGETFPWGGDLPEKVQPFVSKFALWSRLGAGTETSTDTVRAIMDGPLYRAYCDHLESYLRLLAEKSDDPSIGDYHGQRDYVAYRLANDPARPMLKRLFGEDWTEKVLKNVLFPKT